MSIFTAKTRGDNVLLFVKEEGNLSLRIESAQGKVDCGIIHTKKGVLCLEFAKFTDSEARVLAREILKEFSRCDHCGSELK